MKTKGKFYLEAQKYWKTVVSRKKEVDSIRLQLQIEAHKRLFNIFQAGNYYFLLFDIYGGEISEASQEVTGVLGYPPTELDMNRFMESIHPQDKPYFLSFEQNVTAFLKDIAIDKVGQYKIQYDLRLKRKDDRYARLLIQYVLVNYDEHNLYHSFHIHTDITHIKSSGKPHCSIIGFDGEPSYYNIEEKAIVKPAKTIFTKRERQVLKKIVEGCNSQQMADELCVSIHTINAHRKNILAKAEVQTPLQLVKKAINENWI